MNCAVISALLILVLAQDRCSPFLQEDHLNIKPWIPAINCVVQFDHPVYMTIFDFNIGTESYVMFLNQQYNAASPPLESQFFLPSQTTVTIFSPDSFANTDGLYGLLFLFTEALTTVSPSPYSTISPSSSFPTLAPSPLPSINPSITYPPSSTEPSYAPTSIFPTYAPNTPSPSYARPSQFPSVLPSKSPITPNPSNFPITSYPSTFPVTSYPSKSPTDEYVFFPSRAPSIRPPIASKLPSIRPSTQPSDQPSSSTRPSDSSLIPSKFPVVSDAPSNSLIQIQSSSSRSPSTVSRIQTFLPSLAPSANPSFFLVLTEVKNSSGNDTSFMEEILIGSGATLIVAIGVFYVLYRKYILSNPLSFKITVESKIGSVTHSTGSESESETSHLDMGFGFPEQSQEDEDKDINPSYGGGNFLEAQIFNHRIGELSHEHFSDDEDIISAIGSPRIMLHTPSRESTPNASYPFLAPLRYELDLVSEVDTASTASDVKTDVSAPSYKNSNAVADQNLSTRREPFINARMKRFPFRTARIGGTAGDDVAGEVPNRKPRRRVVRRHKREDDYLCE